MLTIATSCLLLLNGFCEEKRTILRTYMPIMRLINLRYFIPISDVGCTSSDQRRLSSGVIDRPNTFDELLDS
jgi:hypothetical protein